MSRTLVAANDFVQLVANQADDLLDLGKLGLNINAADRAQIATVFFQLSDEI